MKKQFTMLMLFLALGAGAAHAKALIVFDAINGVGYQSEYSSFVQNEENLFQEENSLVILDASYIALETTKAIRKWQRYEEGLIHIWVTERFVRALGQDHYRTLKRLYNVKGWKHLYLTDAALKIRLAQCLDDKSIYVDQTETTWKVQGRSCKADDQAKTVYAMSPALQGALIALNFDLDDPVSARKAFYSVNSQLKLSQYIRDYDPIAWSDYLLLDDILRQNNCEFVVFVSQRETLENFINRTIF